MRRKNIYLCFVLGLSMFCGCIFIKGNNSFAVQSTKNHKKKHLFVWQSTENQIAIIKSKIIEEGYKRTRNENFRHEGAICTLYVKGLSCNGLEYEISILISFKETKSAPNVFRNLGLTIVKTKGNDIPEIDIELDRMENILYEKLVELVGAEYVERDHYRKSKMPEGLAELKEE